MANYARDLLNFTFVLLTRKVIIKAFNSILYIALFFLSGFFQKMNEYDDTSSKTCMLWGTKYYHLTKQNIVYTCLLPETEIALQQTCFVVLIYQQQGFLCALVP